MTKYWFILIALVSCNSIDNEPYWDEDGLPHFEWVEPIQFQHDLIICRNSDVCLAQNLF